MDRRITDIHMHVVPKVDDGAADLAMALEMLQMGYDQGARDIYCTSHNAYDEEEVRNYQSQLTTLRLCARSKFPDLTLHAGCELLCAEGYIDDILRGLEKGIYLPLGNSKFVLAELYTDANPAEAKMIVNRLIEAGWHPVLAHAERYPKLFDGHTIAELISLGAKIQINLYSLTEERKDEIRDRARSLVLSRYVHFLGSDAHRTNHRSPKYTAGVEYLYENCDVEFADALCYKNAQNL